MDESGLWAGKMKAIMESKINIIIDGRHITMQSPQDDLLIWCTKDTDMKEPYLEVPTSHNLVN